MPCWVTAWQKDRMGGFPDSRRVAPTPHVHLEVNRHWTNNSLCSNAHKGAAWEGQAGSLSTCCVSSLLHGDHRATERGTALTVAAPVNVSDGTHEAYSTWFSESISQDNFLSLPGAGILFQGTGESEDRCETLTWNHIIVGASPNQGSCLHTLENEGEGEEPRVVKGFIVAVGKARRRGTPGRASPHLCPKTKQQLWGRNTSLCTLLATALP